MRGRPLGLVVASGAALALHFAHLGDLPDADLGRLGHRPRVPAARLGGRLAAAARRAVRRRRAVRAGARAGRRAGRLGRRLLGVRAGPARRRARARRWGGGRGVHADRGAGPSGDVHDDVHLRLLRHLRRDPAVACLVAGQDLGGYPARPVGPAAAGHRGRAAAGALGVQPPAGHHQADRGLAGPAARGARCRPARGADPRPGPAARGRRRAGGDPGRHGAGRGEHRVPGVEVAPVD